MLPNATSRRGNSGRTTAAAGSATCSSCSSAATKRTTSPSALKRLVKDQKAYHGEGFAEVEAANEALVKSALVAALNQALPKQRQRLRDNLTERAEELRKLAAAAQDA